MDNFCPKCKTVYNVTDSDIGREFACYKCNTNLVVNPQGVTRTGGTTEATGDGGASSGAAHALPSEWSLPRMMEGLRQLADLPTGLFALGCFLVILFLFWPLLDQAKIERARAVIKVGDIRDERQDKEMKLKKDVSPADEEIRRRARETWSKEKTKLEDDVAELGVDAQRGHYWHTWGMLLGFLVLAAASLGYLTPSQPIIRRVIGAVVIVAEILLIFVKFVIHAPY
jgi:predicted Zn finger-like uncharacterized protein